MVYFSRKECAFYNEAYKECVEITAEKHNELLAGQSRGLSIVSNKEGYPVLIERAPSVYHKYDGEKWIISESDKIKLRREQQQQAEHKKQQLMLTVSKQIAPLQDAVDLEMASDEEKSLLAALKKYRVLLNRVDVNLVPDIHWPEKPRVIE
ncbi:MULTISPECIES: tail fiber assembly protein [Photorhabdus]|uniref:Tail fiber assembly protein homolog from lambdoid prophage dlp12 n=2 Tax=Photorhabdus asymbiotica TaxID=291112 RepID=B6VLW5_PHOAA|nr:tail fiber assembly protein [Photorhabdus asymbiotica]RKS60197.1 virus tail fiber assembly protein lambda gpK [Photorhabdus asymbiotica]CAQ86364.1 tail fiber assembly protein homolog from lambdoid prophage dlp12 [Photorhabdus asymbiotica]CAR67145.1 tail fiber assembly protein homolog from lambdoid prophage dlp12 [Photorhabdus asymbiotica subsp. asymbiotica ATCC 43949]